MIKIISGTYGFVQNGRILPKTSKSDPFSLDPDREQELVDSGVAVYVAAPVAEATPEHSSDVAGDKLPEYDESMKLADLKEIAAKYGVDASSMRSKAEVIAMIEAAQQPSDEDTPAGDGELPQFDAAPPVV